MREILTISFLLTLLLSGIVGCRRPQSIRIFHWPPADATFDSISSELERDFHDFASPDTIMRQISLLDSIAGKSVGNTGDILRSRTLFWKSRYAYRYGNRSLSNTYILEALAMTDSANRRYDWFRFKSQLCAASEEMTVADQYRHLEEALRYARSIGDLGYEGQTAIALGNLMRVIGENEKALDYYRLCDSLHLQLGFSKLPVKNKINIASTYHDMGRTKEGDSILRSVIGHPALKGDTFAQNLIPRNLFAHDRSDTTYLYQAYRQIHDNERFRYLRGLYRGLLAEHYVGEMELDSARHYSDLSMEDLPYVEEHGHQAIIWYNRGLVYWEEGKADSALLARVQYEICLDSLNRHERKNEVIRLTALEEMRRREARYADSITRRNWIMAFVAVVLIAGGVVAVLMLNRRHMRQRMRSMAGELELEKAKRKMAATAITIEEKDAMLATLRNELSELRREGEIREGSARRLESSIKAHLSEHENEETFREMFDTVNPGFNDRLREICPDLADNYIKLASYMLMELPSKRIASLLMIRPESVRQARWRLRRYLKVPEGVELDEFLRELNKPRMS